MENKKDNYYLAISIFLKFISPFAWWNLIFSFFPQIFNSYIDIKQFYETKFITAIFIFVSISVTMLILLIDKKFLKKIIIISGLWKNKEDRKIHKILITFMILETSLFLIPFLNIISDIYYIFKQKQLTAAYKILEN